MDKDMLAKINEVLKSKGRRELSLDEMDKVSGGDCGSGMINGEVFSRQDFNNMWLTLTDTYGYSVAVQLMKEMTGYNPPMRNRSTSGEEKATGKR